MVKPSWFGLSGKNKNTATLTHQMVTHPLAGQFTDAAVMPSNVSSNTVPFFFNYYYLAVCTMFPHLPAPVWQL